ncbi:MAG TPA: DUF222 domain-containing protein [Acidimicrobiales bacterium]|jgi:hypothetical protein|nr:DUF222 domain-containing protein [Acidimicrobiales bacterium]
MDVDVQTLTKAIDRLAEAGPLVPADPESMESLMRQRARLDAVVTEAAASFDASGDWAPDGAKTAAAWLGRRCRIPTGQARTLIRRGRALSHLPAFARAWSSGAINAAHVDTVAAVHNPSTEEALARDEQVLCDQAATLSFDRYVKAVSYWHQFADPDGTETSYDKRVAARDVYLEKSFDKMWLGGMTMDPVSGTVVSEELGRLEHELFEAEWAEAKGRLGREPTVSDLDRTPGQRRCDALAEMAKRSRTAPEGGKRPVPLISVLVDFPTLAGRICELANGTVVPPGALLSLLDEAYIERAVFAPDKRVEVSETARLFTGATRRAIELRDRTCTHPYCDGTRPCQVDHIIPYPEGGPTNQENGRLLCGFHNRLRNQRPPPSSG